MVSEQRGMVIIGAGECGARAALALREEGYAGPVTLVGAEKHLPYERPPLSKEAMTGEGEAALKEIASAEKLFEAAVMLLSCVEAQSIDRTEKSVRLSNGATLRYNKLLLATGASPRRLPLAETSRRCAVLRTFDEAQAIRARLKPGSSLLVVGGGFIGLELAASARKLGVDVTVVEAAPRILGRAVPAEIAALLHARHEAEGVRILVGIGIQSIEDTENGVRLRLADGSAAEADFCVIGIGAQPNTKLAEDAGLKIENGIAVDDTLHTDDPDILAAGDCCSFPLSHYANRRVRLEAWRNAQEQGTLAARNMLGAKQAHLGVPWFWSDQYDLSLQIAGLADEAMETVRRDVGAGAFILFHLAADGRLLAASGIGPGNAVARDIRLAEMLIAKGAHPPREKLAAPETKLKTLLAA